jgi:hypothetical protein
MTSFPYLPVLSGRVLGGSCKLPSAFLYDLRQTVSELVTENFLGGNAAALQCTRHAHSPSQPYITTGNDLNAANFTDEPMGEFWSHPFQPNDYRDHRQSRRIHCQSQRQAQSSVPKRSPPPRPNVGYHTPRP